MDIFSARRARGGGNFLSHGCRIGARSQTERGAAVRPIQAEYQCMHLPNNEINPANQHRDIRLPVGIVFRFTR
jgi:hypothetical protein